MANSDLSIETSSAFEIYYYCKCFGKSECLIPLYTYGTDEYFDYNSHTIYSFQLKFFKGKFVPNLEYKDDAFAQVPYKKILAVAECQEQDPRIFNPFKPSTPLKKENLGTLIVIIDIITILILIIFTWALENGQRLYY